MFLFAAAHAAEPISFGPKGLSFSDAGGDNLLNLGFSFQPRLSLTFAGDPEASADEALVEPGFRIRRMLFTANGTAGRHVDYRFRVNVAPTLSLTDGDGKTQTVARPVLDDAQITLRFVDAVQPSLGQWKVPFTVSQAMGDGVLLFPDRSIVIDGFKYGDTKLEGWSWSRDAGAALLGNVGGKRLDYGIGVFNGDGQGVWPQDDGFLYAGRVQVAPLGEMKLDEVDLAHGPARLAIGASGSYNLHPAYDDAGEAVEAGTVLRAGGDLRFTAAGLSFQAEGLYGRSDAGEDADPVEAFGAYAQLGYALGPVAPGLRWSRFDPALDADADAVTQLEGVLNWYLPDPKDPKANLGHKAKLQLGWSSFLLEGADDPLAHQAVLSFIGGL